MSQDNFGKRATPSLADAMYRNCTHSYSSPRPFSSPVPMDNDQVITDKIDTILQVHFAKIKEKLDRIAAKVKRIELPVEKMESILEYVQSSGKHESERNVAETKVVTWRRKFPTVNSS